MINLYNRKLYEINNIIRLDFLKEIYPLRKILLNKIYVIERKILYLILN